MRIGTNPEKINVKELIHKNHRVIIPVYIPNLEDEYFNDSLKIFKICFKSLLNTIDINRTNITIIDNNSTIRLYEFLKEYIDNKIIDKYIKNASNRGKVEPILSEARASFEEYITITDADVFFRKNWLINTVKIFNSFEKAGVVSPIAVPNLYNYHNDIAYLSNYFSNNIKKSKIVKTIDLLEFEKSIGSKDLMKKYYDKQFYIENNNIKACLGSAHFIATYKKNIFFNDKLDKKIPSVFPNGLEEIYIDALANKFGLWRLSTIENLVYHMGNIFEDIQIEKVNIKNIPDFQYLNFRDKQKSNIELKISKLVMKILKRLSKND